MVARAEQRDVPITTEFVGALDGYINVDIRARVAGYLRAQAFREGGFVQAGQLLFTIDPREYQAAVEQARAALARARAAHEVAQLAVQRLRPLVSVNAVSQQDYDTAVSNELQTAAQVRAAKAALQQAELNLSYTRITSPIAGIAGVAQVRIGNLVGLGAPTLLTTVSQVDPIRVQFGISERDYLAYARRLRSDAGTPSPRIELVLADGSVYPEPGEFAFANRAVDPSTGTLQVQALFPNPHQLLRPGQYGRVRVESDVLENAVLVPQVAITSLQGISQVGVVGPDNVVHVRRVELGPTMGGSVVIRRGVAAGEAVVVEGLQKVREGQKVTPRPATQPPSPARAPGVGGAADAGAPSR